MIDAVYWGLFFDEFDLPIGTLERKVPHKHVTFGYKTPMPEDLVGKKSLVKVVGLGKDQNNEAYAVLLDQSVWKYFNGDPISSPHITLSLSSDGKAKDSRFLDFHLFPEDERFDIVGTFGYFDGEKYNF